MSKKKPEVYLSLDIESDGGTPGLNNMLTMAIVAFSDQGEEIGEFYERIIELPDLRPDPETMIWWRDQDSHAYYEAFDKYKPGIVAGSSSKDRTTAFDAMLNLAGWLNYLAINTETNNFTPMAWPAAFDHPFIKYYSTRFLGKSVLGYDCIDIRSYAQGYYKKHGYHDLKEEELNRLAGTPKPRKLQKHFAKDDAILQGHIYFRVRDSQ